MPGPDTTATDVERFLGSSPAVVAIESELAGTGTVDPAVLLPHGAGDLRVPRRMRRSFLVSRVPVVPPRALEYNFHDPVAELLKAWSGIKNSTEPVAPCGMLWLHPAWSSRSSACAMRR